MTIDGKLRTIRDIADYRSQRRAYRFCKVCIKGIQCDIKLPRKAKKYSSYALRVTHLFRRDFKKRKPIFVIDEVHKYFCPQTDSLDGPGSGKTYFLLDEPKSHSGKGVLAEEFKKVLDLSRKSSSGKLILFSAPRI